MGADLSIEFHFNGAVRNTVTGHEVLHYRGSKGGERIASIMDKAFDENLKNRDRGLKPRGVFDNGGYGLYVGRYPSILVEPFFNSQLPKYITDGEYREELNSSLHISIALCPVDCLPFLYNFIFHLKAPKSTGVSFITS